MGGVVEEVSSSGRHYNQHDTILKQGFRSESSMPRSSTIVPSEMTILRRVVDPDNPTLSEEAARALLRLKFQATDRQRINRLAARNRDGKLSSAEEEELANYIRVGQTLGILQSKARRSLKAIRQAAR